MEGKKEAPREGGAKTIERPQDTAPRRLPRADELKRAIDPAAFYEAELPDAPLLKRSNGAWSQNILCPFHDEDTGSFGVNLDTGAARCFGCEFYAGGVIDFTMTRHDLDFDQAREKLAKDWNLSPAGNTGQATASRHTRPAPRAPAPRPPAMAPASEPRPITPIPSEALATRPQIHPTHGKPSAEWTYRDPTGAPLFFVCRFDPPGKRKQFSPLTYWPGGWHWKAPPEPRPLYVLDHLTARPDAPVLICEGEKAADAAGELLPQMAPVTTSGGAQAPAKTDLAPLRGRHVFVWPDNDPAGAKYAQAVAELARAAGAESVSILDLSRLARDPVTGKPRDLAKGWDAADALRDGWTPETLATAIRWEPIAAPDPATKRTKRAAEPDAPALPRGFEITDEGLFYIKRAPAQNGGEPGEPIRVNVTRPAVTVGALGRDEHSESWSWLLEWADRDGVQHSWLMPGELLQTSGDDLRKALARGGCHTNSTPEARRLLLDYIRESRPTEAVLAARQSGWFADGEVFVLGAARSIGETNERVMLQSEHGEPPPFASKGTLGDWREHVARLCVGNSRLVFAVSFAFAPPLLRLVGDQSGGFHLKGSSVSTSSTGKTTTQLVGVSVCGPPEYQRSWRHTDNAAEGAAASHNDCPSFPDDIGHADNKAVGAMIYMLAGGQEKGRLNRDSSMRVVRRWRLLFLSSGEVGLAELMAEARQKIRAGQEVRMLEIPADAGAGRGVFETLHGYPDGAAFSRALVEASANYHGTAFPAFIENLIQQRADIPALVKRLRGRFLEMALEHLNPTPPVYRAADRFGLVAAAGELATAAGITGWEPGATMEAVLACFRAWLQDRGGAGSADETRLIRQVRLFFEKHYNRFRWLNRALDDHYGEVPHQAGFKEATDGAITYFAFPETYREEIVAGYNPTEAADVLIRNGLLLPDSNRDRHQKRRFPGFQNPRRVYVFGDEVSGGGSGV